LYKAGLILATILFWTLKERDEKLFRFNTVKRKSVSRTCVAQVCSLLANKRAKDVHPIFENILFLNASHLFPS